MLLEILSVLIGCLILYKQNSCISLSLILFVYYNALHFLSDEVDMFVIHVQREANPIELLDHFIT